MDEQNEGGSKPKKQMEVLMVTFLLLLQRDDLIHQRKSSFFGAWR